MEPFGLFWRERASIREEHAMLAVSLDPSHDFDRGSIGELQQVTATILHCPIMGKDAPRFRGLSIGPETTASSPAPS